jgi:hypothetical protein
MQTQIANVDLNALADFALSTFDYSADYEEDQFAFTFEGVRVFCERKRCFFRMDIAGQIVELPRC